jgi:hypothetical protein
MKKLLLLLSIIIFFGECSTADTSICTDTNCANYTSKLAAQAAFDADPKCRADLDQNKNGIACEEPGNSVKNCASTSNCGCSNKTKSECESNPCCQWIVGTGCKCR